MEWRHAACQWMKKLNSVPSIGKVVVAGFWDETGTVLLNFVARATVMNSTAILNQ